MRSVNQRIISSLKREDTNANRIKSGQERISGAMILKATSDDKSWILFSTIAISSDSDGQQSGGGSRIILSKLNLKRKQYYQRINLGPYR
jgi:hypothetical protein